MNRAAYNEETDGKLGAICAKYESLQGPATISTGEGDDGGISYGTYQLASTRGRPQEFVTKYYPEEFKGLVVNSQAFKDKWQALAKDDPNFVENEYRHIKQTHYDKQMNALKEIGIDLTSHDKAVHEMVWLTSVQYGPSSSVIAKALIGAFGKGYDYNSVSSEKIIDCVEQYKINSVDTYFESSSASVRENLKNIRFPRERSDLLDSMGITDISYGQEFGQGQYNEQIRDIKIALKEAGYKTNNVDFKFSSDTTEAVKAFQADNNITPTGIFDANTREILFNQVGVIDQNNPAFRFEQKINDTFAQITELNTQLSALDEAADAETRNKIQQEITDKRQAIAQLEIEKAAAINEQTNKLQNEKTELTHQFDANATKLAALDAIEIKLNQATTDQRNGYAEIRTDMEKTGVSILSEHQQKLLAKDSLDLTNKSDIKDLQQVLHDEEFLKATPNGNFGPQTQTALREALGKEADYAFDTTTPLDKLTLNQLTQYFKQPLISGRCLTNF